VDICIIRVPVRKMNIVLSNVELQIILMRPVNQALKCLEVLTVFLFPFRHLLYVSLPEPSQNS
jgi:hypothetical protein